MADDNGLNSKVGLDVTDFKRGITELNASMKSIEAGFRASAAVMGNWSSSTNGLQERTTSLSQKLDLQKQKLNILHEEYDKVVKSSGATSAAAESLAGKMFSAEKAIASTEKDLSKYSEQLKNVKKNEEEATNPLSKMKSEFSSFSSKLKESTSGIGKIGSGISSGLATGAKAVATTAAGIGAAVVGATAGIYKLSEKASDLNEAQNVVQQTFKKSSDSVLTWTNTITASAGLGKTAATQMVGSMGAMMKSSGLSEQSASGMSEKLVQLSGDLASFYNLNNEDAWEKIRSGISGETEPLKQLGINMDVANLSAFALSEGIKKPYKEMSQAEQTTLRYNYLLSVTKDAQGDFSRTAGGMANQTRLAHENLTNLAQTVGGKFLPSVNSMLPPFNTLISAFTTFIATGKNAGQVTTAINDLVTGIKNSVSTMLPQITTIVTSIVSLIGQTVPAILPQLLAIAVSALKVLASALIQAIPMVLPVFASSIVQLVQAATQILQQNGTMLITAGLNAIMTLIQGISQALPQITQAAIQTILTLINGITAQLPTLVPMALSMILTIANGLISNLPQIINSAIKIILALIQGIMNALPQLIDEVPKIIIGIIDGIVGALPQLIAAAPKIIVSIITGIIKALPQLILAAPKIIAAIITGLITSLPQLLTMGPQMLKELWDGLSKQNWPEIGMNILKGIVNGFGQIGSWIWGKIQDAGNMIVNGFKSFFGIHSPSKLMDEEVGQFLGLGIAQGIQKIDFMGSVAGNIAASKSKISQAIQGLSSDMSIGVKAQMQPAFAGAYAPQQTTVQNSVTLPKYLYATINLSGQTIGTVITPIVGSGLNRNTTDSNLGRK